MTATRPRIRMLPLSLTVLLLVGLLTPTAGAQTPPVPPQDDPNLATTCFGVPGADFDDVRGAAAFVHGTAIDCLRAYGLTEGTSEGLYEPAAGIRRWQMALFLTRLAALADDQLAALDLPAAGPTGFDDVAALSDEARDAISVLEQTGVTQGVTATMFEPFARVTRGQMAAFINRLQGVIQEALGGDPDGFPAAGDFFPDDDGTTHEADINAIATVGITKGSLAFGAPGDPLVFGPGATVTRAQMASFLIRHLAMNVNDDALTSNFPLLEGATEAEFIGEEFVDALAAGNAGAAAGVSTPRAFDVGGDFLGQVDASNYDFDQFSDPEFPGPQEWGGEGFQGFFSVPLELGAADDGLLACNVQAGLVRTCDRLL